MMYAVISRFSEDARWRVRCSEVDGQEAKQIEFQQRSKLDDGTVTLFVYPNQAKAFADALREVADKLDPITLPTPFDLGAEVKA